MLKKLKQYSHRLMAPLHRKEAIRQIRQMEKKLISPKTRFAIPFVFRGKGLFRRIEPRQNPFEIESLYDRVAELKPQRVLEIGTARGGTLYLWMQAASADAELASVDLPDGDFGGAYPLARVPFYQAFPRPNQKLTLLRTDSHLPETLDKVKACFSAPVIDFAFIDGDHTYEGVKQDFETYAPLVRKGGLVAFHDILPRPAESGIKVDQFWNEIKNNYEYEEFIGSPETGRAIGIGLLRIK
ncbi:MAG: class I SAM-dependent methyltransferase [Gammaproteobacteria bacterium]|nr:class I SAM-dependent methyltransferase [Gammaproteobacteria bacterium]